jgi:hypothetical protein
LILNSLMRNSDILTRRKATIEEALAYFDHLEPVHSDFMIGRWKGFEIATGHTMDGLLEPSGWYGKLFVDRENVHPLLIFTFRKRGIYAINPRLVPLSLPLPRNGLLKVLMAMLSPVLKTKTSRARLRQMEYRGKLTATMAYDDRPIFDHFAKINDRTLLGAMDMKGESNPYFFVLERDEESIPIRL